MAKPLINYLELVIEKLPPVERAMAIVGMFSYDTWEKQAAATIIAYLTFNSGKVEQTSIKIILLDFEKIIKDSYADKHPLNSDDMPAEH